VAYELWHDTGPADGRQSLGSCSVAMISEMPLIGRTLSLAWIGKDGTIDGAGSLSQRCQAHAADIADSPFPCKCWIT
jgi:hypothetical protein